jgi:hypothetical protein
MRGEKTSQEIKISGVRRSDTIPGNANNMQPQLIFISPPRKHKQEDQYDLQVNTNNYQETHSTGRRNREKRDARDDSNSIHGHDDCSFDNDDGILPTLAQQQVFMDVADGVNELRDSIDELKSRVRRLEQKVIQDREASSYKDYWAPLFSFEKDQNEEEERPTKRARRTSWDFDNNWVPLFSFEKDQKTFF